MPAQPRWKTAIHLLIILICWSWTTMKPPSSYADPPSHHTQKGYRNLYDPSERGLGGLLRWQLGLGSTEPPFVSPDQLPPYKPDVVTPDFPRIKNPDPNQIQITWVGHSTFLIQTEGVNILTDPIFNDRSSPFSIGGIRRLVPPALKLEDLPPMDVVMISHNHYDHLDKHSIEGLGNKPTYLVPLGLGRWLKKRKIENVVELDWWQASSSAGLKFYSVPVQHFSGRTPFDRNKTLWSGWIVEGKIGKIFFAGDTGYSPVFREIGERFGPIRVSMIPIGAYRPRWFMKPVHVDPPEAVRIHQDTNSQQSIASHWGTFKLSDEPIGEPPRYLEKALKDAGLDEDKFIIMRFGETLSFR
ncbi:MAG TPA: MBL fold metallo-hydrolase [Thermodesulfobacteriota bacterium]|nr:MBL fold metallo-hydrolase [Thermodesulfobacteriota bacterium]